MNYRSSLAEDMMLEPQKPTSHHISRRRKCSLEPLVHLAAVDEGLVQVGEGILAHSDLLCSIGVVQVQVGDDVPSREQSALQDSLMQDAALLGEQRHHHFHHLVKSITK